MQVQTAAKPQRIPFYSKNFGPLLSEKEMQEAEKSFASFTFSRRLTLGVLKNSKKELAALCSDVDCFSEVLDSVECWRESLKTQLNLAEVAQERLLFAFINFNGRFLKL